MADVLRMALDALSTCSCNQDPEKDGCYRCLYQYRLGRSMELVSRDNAKAVLTDLVGSLGALERVKTISDIYINPNFDSVLEARFIESLKKLSGVGGLPAVKLVQDVVNGKSGYLLEVGAQRYRVEPQAELNGDHGVVVPSKPDFVIWPWAAGSKRRPVAVFCDGWAYHKDCMRDDALKRSAIVASGGYWVWSVTHQDVAAALAVNLDTDLESPLVAMSRHEGAKAPDTVPRAQEKAFTHHGVARLLQWLAIGSDGGDTDPAVETMQRNAAWLEFLMIPNTADDKAASDGQRAHWLPRLPLYIREPGAGFAPVMSRANGPAAIIGWWAMALAKGLPIPGAWLSPGAVVLDEPAAPDEDALHRGWRRWLQLYNTAQFMPGVLMATTSGLDAHDYESLGAMGGGAQAPGKPQGHAGLSAAWQAVLEQTLSELAGGLKSLAVAGATPPEVGTELADEKGKVLADAELTWVDQKLALLRSDQADLADAWQAAGWTAQVLDDKLSTVQGQPWSVAVADTLGLTLKNEGE